MRELTDRQREVLLLIAAGLSINQIAKRLHVSTHTVNHHMRSLYRNLGVHDRTAICIVGIYLGEITIAQVAAIAQTILDNQPAPDGGTP